MSYDKIVEELEKQLTDKLRDTMGIGIEMVVSGQKDQVKLIGARPNDVEKFIKETYDGETGEFDTNGWEWDYWLYFEINEKRYILSGDGYYNNYAWFRKCEDDE